MADDVRDVAATDEVVAARVEVARVLEREVVVAAEPGDIGQSFAVL